jgi:hypothetical protein
MTVAWKHHWKKMKNRSRRSTLVASLLFHCEQVKREGENPRGKSEEVLGGKRCHTEGVF